MRFPKASLAVVLFTLGSAAAEGQLPGPPTLIAPKPALSAPSARNTTAPAAAAAAEGTQKARVSGGVMAGNLLTRVNPVYPPEAKAAGVSGIVVLHAIIGSDGSVYKLTAISGPPVLAAAAIDAVQQWTYKPYLLNGNPTEVDTTITVNFQLNHPPPTPQP